jgi:2-phospho-L-lactate guanylyltransferase
MNEVWALLPVKSPGQAKTRLASLLQPQECASLSRAMLTDVLTALNESEHIDKIAVLTNDKDIMALANRLGYSVIEDPSDSALCDSLNSAAQHIAARGAKTLLIVPADMPTISAHDIDELLDRHTSGLSVCPAIRDGGTNALVCSPPNAMRFQFGPDSARRHIDEAARCNVPHARLAMHAYFRDIDTPDDLAWLANQAGAPHTLRFLREAGIIARLGPGVIGAAT